MLRVGETVGTCIWFRQSVRQGCFKELYFVKSSIDYELILRTQCLKSCNFGCEWELKNRTYLRSLVLIGILFFLQTQNRNMKTSNMASQRSSTLVIFWRYKSQFHLLTQKQSPAKHLSSKLLCSLLHCPIQARGKNTRNVMPQKKKY